MAENPLATDAKLKQLLVDVDSIKSEDAFKNWRTSFLKAYLSYLDPDGIANARDNDGRLIKKLQSLAKVSFKVKKLCGNGNICEQQVTAEGRNGINQLNTEMRAVEQAIEAFCPKTSKDEDTVGYDKFELGAVLIKDGFHAYDIMLTTRDFITDMRDGPLDGILDKSTLQIMEFYSRGIQSFVAVMADLGLMKLMDKCVEIYKDKPRPPPKAPKDDKPPNDRSGEEIISNHGKGPDTPSKHTKGRSQSPEGKGKSTADFSGGQRKKGDEEEAFDPKGPPEDADIDTPPPAEGAGAEADNLIYFDPKTGAIGMLKRDQCAAESELIMVKDDKGEDLNLGVIEEEDEKQELVWLLKKLEKKKPAEENWLDKIKREKAAKKAADDKGSSNGKSSTSPKSSSKKKPLKRGLSGKASKTSPKASSKGYKGSGSKQGDSGGWGSNPLEQSAGSKKKGPGMKPRASNDYQGEYKKKAAKPASDGWSKIS